MRESRACRVLSAPIGSCWTRRPWLAIWCLRLVAGQDVEPANGSDGTDGRWRIARKVAEDRIISTVDPEARHTRKSPEARRDGYRAHVAAEPDTGIITDEQLTKAAGTENSDPAVAQRFLANDIANDIANSTNDIDIANSTNDIANDSTNNDSTNNDSTSDEHAGRGQDNDTDPATRRQWYGDSAYGTGDLRGDIADAGHEAVIKPKPLQSPVEGGFTVDDFIVDEHAGTVTCPNGNTRPISTTRVATFGAL